MRVLLLGASGLIGSAVAARLARDGHWVIGAARSVDPAARRVPVAEWRTFDLREKVRPEDWLSVVEGVEAVVNCAGALQASLRDSPWKVHRDAPAALWSACEQAGVRRVIHLSAMGVDRGGITDFSRSKGAGDAALAATGLDWVILRPSVVVGRAAYGGSALFRGLAALPYQFRVPDTGPVDLIQLDDVAETVALMLQPDAPARVALELAGPDRLEFGEVVAAYRRWLGWRPAREVGLPSFLLALGWRLGDLAAWFGWRPPIRSTARREIVRGAIGDNREWTRLTGIRPQSLADALAAHPASVQERWFARLYLLKPVAIGTFALFWLVTGIVSLTAGWQHAVDVMRLTPAADLAEAAVLGGALVDLIVGVMILVRGTAKAGLVAALGVSLLYIVLGTFLLPALWADPLGPMTKIWPILALNLLCLAILDER
ncbi:MAG TPA: SDR family oxidoreductase [Allosphingosinicella sp.]